MSDVRLTAGDLDALREIGNIGAGHAATALSRVIGGVVSLEIPVVRALELGEVPGAVGGPEQAVAAIHLRVDGEVPGNLLIVFPPDAAVSLLRRMGLEVDTLEDVARAGGSALREMGNILASSYLSAISSLLRRSLVPSVPGLAVDMAGAVVDLLLMDLAGASLRATVLETAFRDKNGVVHGQFYFLPDPGSVSTLLERVRSLA